MKPAATLPKDGSMLLGSRLNPTCEPSYVAGVKGAMGALNARALRGPLSELPHNLMRNFAGYDQRLQCQVAVDF